MKVLFLLPVVAVVVTADPLPFFGYKPVSAPFNKGPVSSYSSLSSRDKGSKALFFIEPETSVQSSRTTAYKPILSYKARPRYSYDWAVKDDYTRNDFKHQETRDGDRTRGSYSVLLPDGRIQTVKYYVSDDSGFVAEVSYEGKASYPSYKPAYNHNHIYG